ncbi:leucine-rich repeats and immunoglobulin-like domains protein 1 [Lepisosteus oculatus]|uniref:leucine-rich repeats and immunoglobulin-like domains protein 1 n=1 Tax=Lepisosteus oculatus TaxID=7918 RepID=UPI003723E86D
MAATLGQIGLLPYYFLQLIFLLKLPVHFGLSTDLPCALNCTCTNDLVDCSNLGLTDIPQDLPVHTVYLNLSHNKLTAIDQAALSRLPNLQEVHLEHNKLTAIPSFGTASSKIVSLYLHHNKIRNIEADQLKVFTSLETLDLNNNNITEIRNNCLPSGLQIKNLYLGSNRISTLEGKAFDNLSQSLQVLRLSKNWIEKLPVKGFQLPQLTQLELNRNKLRLIEGLTFQGLDSLEVLKLQRNNISKLTDGAFWGLGKMKVLHLDYNSLTEVNSGSLYGLFNLLHLYLNNNSISHINPDGWGFCKKLKELVLSYNSLTRLDEGSLAVLGDLQILRLSRNSISHIAEGAFRGLRTLRLLELDHNDISGTIEDTNGAFTGLDSLSKLTLFGNKIKSVARKAFSGLEALEHLNLGNNAIRSVQPEAFSKMKKLRELHINSNSFLCDCNLKWFPEWLVEKRLQSTVMAVCAHPESLKGTSVFQAPGPSFVCDDVSKPQITVHPETTMAVLGKDIRFTCTAASSSSSPITFAWRKDQEVLEDAEMENFAHMRAKDGEVMEYTTILHLRRVTFAHEGRYQCIITNHFGSTYSGKARLTVNVLPSFTKTPSDLTIRTGTTARLECAAEGHPTPQIAWHKDGGTDFPAARERRMHIMPNDVVFFITNVKIEDMGVYSCTAENTAGTIAANATLTVLETPYLKEALEDQSVLVGDTVALQCKASGSPPPRITWLKGDEPLKLSERHHFTPGNQLLIIRNVEPEDEGRYTCLMSNTLGAERAHCQLSVQRHSGCAVDPTRRDSTMTVGIIIIAVVCSIVITSLVWVCIIYQTRKKSEECSVTNTDETIIPADVPSYLSSQGTLSDRQEVCIRVEANNGPQPNGHIESNGICRIDTRGSQDLENHVDFRPAKLCISGPEGCNGEDECEVMMDPEKNGYGVPVVCTDCLENASNSRDQEQVFQGFRTLGNAQHTPRSTERGRLDVDNLGSSDTQHCNGTVNTVKRDGQAPVYPSNHDRIASSERHYDKQGSSSKDAGTSLPLGTVCPLSSEGSFHKPIKLVALPQTSMDNDCGAEVRQTLLPNGHLPRTRDAVSENTPLRRASD